MWYLVSPLLINKSVNEQLPIVNQGQISQIIYEGQFLNADSLHKTSGKAKMIQVGEEKYLRLENFKTTNGPDLKVYLSKDKEAKEYISLGELKGNIGDQNYEIPSDVDSEDYNNVLIWCEKFSVLFGSAELEPQ